MPVLTMLLATLLTVPAGAPSTHVVVYREAGRFGGWPANNGIWCWGNEIVVGFTQGYHQDKEGHTIDDKKPQVPRLARSLDGGLTWKIEVPSYLDADGKEKQPVACTTPMDFSHPDFAFMMRMEGSSSGYSRFYWSNDRCKTWNGPFELPGFQRKGIFARTDLLIGGPRELTAFVTAAKETGGEGWPLGIRTTDGGLTWKELGYIGQEPGQGGYAIMPSTVRLSPTELFTYIRCRASGGERKWWIEPYRSMDDGKTWTLENENTIDNAGNPAHMIKLKDGRLALTFGYRRAPFGIRARISSDQGKTWGPDILLREDGGNWDLGYPRSVQRPDGKIVTVYYFNDSTDKFRYIAATIWDPR